MVAVLQRIGIACLILLAMVGVGWLLRPPKDHRSGDPDPRYNVDRPQTEIEQMLSARPQRQKLEEAQSAVDLLNIKAAILVPLQSYLIDHGKVPNRLEDLFGYGLDPRYLKDTKGLDIHYEVLDDGARGRIWSYGPDLTGNTADDLEVFVP